MIDNPYIATVKIRWLSSEEVGRGGLPPIRHPFFVNARFSEQGEDIFSVVLFGPLFKPDFFGVIDPRANLDYNLDFASPELLVDRLVPGTKIWITEGWRNIGEGQITKINIDLIKKITQQRPSPV